MTPSGRLGQLAHLALLAALVASQGARAEGVALALTLPDKSAVHRDFAAGMVNEAYNRFEMLSPQLRPDDVDACQTDEGCLLRLAHKHAASHLLLVGVAALGPEELVVSLRLLDVVSKRELVNLSDLAPPGPEPFVTGSTLAAKSFEKVAGVPGKKQAAPAVVEVEPEKPPPPPQSDAGAAPRGWNGLTPLSLVGWGVAGLATLAVPAAVVIGVPLFATELGSVYSIGAATAVVGGYAVGLGLVTADAYLSTGE